MKQKKMLLTIALLALVILAGCTTNQQETSSQSVQGLVVAKDGVTQEAKIENGIQQVILSWGKFNYNPEVIKVKANLPVKVTADMDRLTGCFRSFEIPALGIDESFTEKNNAVEFTPTKSGRFTFGCAMGMGQGTLVVE